jgi:hypothetical protein
VLSWYYSGIIVALQGCYSGEEEMEAIESGLRELFRSLKLVTE